MLCTEVGREEWGIIHLGGELGSFYVVPILYLAWRGAKERGWTGRAFYEEFARFVEGERKRAERERESRMG